MYREERSRRSPQNGGIIGFIMESSSTTRWGVAGRLVSMTLFARGTLRLARTRRAPGSCDVRGTEAPRHSSVTNRLRYPTAYPAQSTTCCDRRAAMSNAVQTKSSARREPWALGLAPHPGDPDMTLKKCAQPPVTTSYPVFGAPPVPPESPSSRC